MSYLGSCCVQPRKKNGCTIITCAHMTQKDQPHADWAQWSNQKSHPNKTVSHHAAIALLAQHADAEGDGEVRGRFRAPPRDTLVLASGLRGSHAKAWPGKDAIISRKDHANLAELVREGSINRRSTLHTHQVKWSKGAGTLAPLAFWVQDGSHYGAI